MSLRRPITRALLPIVPAALLALGLTAAPAAATSPPDTVWGSKTVLAGSPAAGARDVNIVSRGDGAALAVWIENDGVPRLRSSVLSPSTGAWSTPEWVSPSGDYAYGFTLTSSGVGRFVLGWASAGSPTQIREMPAGQLTWSPAYGVADPGEFYTGGNSTSTGTGVAFVALSDIGGQKAVKIFRSVGSNEALAEVHEAPIAGSASLQNASIDFNSSGDGVVTWEATEGGSLTIWSMSYDASSNDWSAPLAAATIDDPGDAPPAAGALSSDGTAVITFVDGDAQLDQYGQPATFNFVRAVTRAPDSPTWSAPETLADDSGMTLLMGVAATDADTVVAAYQRYAFDPGAGAYLPAPVVHVLDTTTGTWAPAEALASFGGAPTIATGPSGDVVVTYLASEDGASFQSGVSVFDAQTGERSDLGLAAGSNPFPPDGMGISTVSPAGDVLVGYVSGEDGRSLNDAGAGFSGISVVLADRGAPQIGGVTVPSTVAADEDFDVSANGLDFFAPPATVSWDFGDDSDNEDGDEASHSYDAPGSYTITVTATGLNGRTSTETRQVTVPAPAAPPAQPAPTTKPPAQTTPTAPRPAPAVTPPAPAPKPVVSEARLSGRRVTIDARVSLRKGRRCRGVVKATSRVGGASYRVSLRLRSVSGNCRARGTIRLRRAPSAGTKVRVKVSAKTIRSRTLRATR